MEGGIWRVTLDVASPIPSEDAMVGGGGNEMYPLIPVGQRV